MPDEIRFYSKDEANGFLSNFHPCKVVVDGLDFPSSEHAYQWRRANKPEIREWIRLAPTARLAAEAARHLRPHDVEAYWLDIRVAWMRHIVWCKFDQNNTLAQMLDATGDAILVESSPYDEFWGQKPGGTGENWLGKILMAVRDCLRNGPKSEYQKFRPEVPP